MARHEMKSRAFVDSRFEHDSYPRRKSTLTKPLIGSLVVISFFRVLVIAFLEIAIPTRSLGAKRIPHLFGPACRTRHVYLTEHPISSPIISLFEAIFCYIPKLRCLSKARIRSELP